MPFLSKPRRQVLEAIAATQPDAYGVSVYDHLQGHFSLGRLYLIATWLEERGLITSTEDKGHIPAKRYTYRKTIFALTDKGMVALGTPTPNALP